MKIFLSARGARLLYASIVIERHAEPSTDDADPCTVWIWFFCLACSFKAKLRTSVGGLRGSTGRKDKKEKEHSYWYGKYSNEFDVKLQNSYCPSVRAMGTSLSTSQVGHREGAAKIPYINF